MQGETLYHAGLFLLAGAAVLGVCLLSLYLITGMILDRKLTEEYGPERHTFKHRPEPEST